MLERIDRINELRAAIEVGTRELDAGLGGELNSEIAKGPDSISAVKWPIAVVLCALALLLIVVGYDHADLLAFKGTIANWKETVWPTLRSIFRPEEAVPQGVVRFCSSVQKSI